MKSEQKRTKIVSFRVTAEEYDELERYRVARGVQNISDYARAVTFALPIDGQGSFRHQHPLTTEIHIIHCKIEELEREVKRLAEAVNQS